MSRTPPVILSIAGFDPSAGAGISADIKTIAAHGCYGVACITALTVQSTAGVRRVESLSGDLIRDTLRELSADLQISGVRIGMLGSGEAAGAVADYLESMALSKVVLDPVVRSSSGAELLDAKGVEVLKRRLLRLATITTPNVDEAAFLTGMPVSNTEQMRAAAEELHRLGAKHVVITGGHLRETVEVLRLASGEFEEFRGARLESQSTHGTGCAFATSLTCNLVLGKSVREAVCSAKDYVTKAILNAYPMGRGTGPVNHLYRWKE